ncbi:Eco29kI family restriction endonuclease [Sphaerothrix gracilis]|uniref:Eco29kI family restriction endonuclease n=1 Tax=Sphaerothrix gracilis TaxID=3151835 RepID=UPI0031FBFF4D
MTKARPGSPAALVEKLREDLANLAALTAAGGLSAPARRKLEADMRAIVVELEELLLNLDPIRQPAAVFDPGNPKIIGRFISLAMVAQPRVPLAELQAFYGSGVYALYYNGDFPLYEPIKGTETPIYVGQAAPAINNARTPKEQEDRLARRLRDHAGNIARATSTLRLEDFEFRSLVVQSGWETAAEDYLIHLFQPIWNSETKILYGLGKHGDSATTRANKRSPWDTLHPGRTWAADSTDDARTPEQIEADLTRHFAETRIYATLDDVLHDFVAELSQI